MCLLVTMVMPVGTGELVFVWQIQKRKYYLFIYIHTHTRTRTYITVKLTFRGTDTVVGYKIDKIGFQFTITESCRVTVRVREA